MNRKTAPSYRRMIWTDRLIIEKFYNKGDSFRSIAKMTGFCASSVYREIQHGLYPHLGAETTRRPYHYSVQIAQDYANLQATSKGQNIKLGHNHAYANYVSAQIQQGRSPDQITGTLRKAQKWTVSTPILYRYIDNGYIPNVTNRDLHEKPSRKRPYRHTQATRPPKGTSIEHRPQAIRTRQSFGHWELDSVIGKSKGKNQSLLVLTERKTRCELILRAQGKTSAATVQALNQLLPVFPAGTFKTITVDNGSEFQDCQGMEHDTNGNKRLAVYYCHPYTSCERGSNERNNRIIRRYLPKGQSLHDVTQGDCDRIAAAINDMPRKILGYATAKELFDREIAALLAAQSAPSP